MIKILLTDDEHHVINHISKLIEQINFCEISLIKTTSGPEALQIASDTHIDIAFLDINMPQISGLQIASRLHSQWPDCQLIFLTAYERFDYIYQANKFPNAIYLLKAESDAQILKVTETCCQTILTKRNEKIQLSDAQRQQKILALLQEQHLLREILHGNPVGDWKHFVNKTALDIRFSFEKNVYLMLMHIRRSPSSYYDYSFYLEKMEYLLENVFTFSFIETEKNFFLWIFQNKDTLENNTDCFLYLKDSMDSFLDICSESKHQTLTLYISPKQVPWSQIARSYQHLYDAYFDEGSLLSTHSSIAKVMTDKCTESSSEIASVFDNKISSTDLTARLSSMKQALYQGNSQIFLTDLQYCRSCCTSIKSMHNTDAIKIWFSIVLIFLDYISHYKLEQKISMEIALYPLYFITDFPNWDRAFFYLQKLSDIIFRMTKESSNTKNNQLITSIQKYIQQHLSENLNLTVISNYVNYNESHVSRLFKRHTGINLSDYINSCRIEQAKVLLIQTDDTIQIISQKTGFHTSQYFSSSFRKSTGISPNEYRIQNRSKL